MDTRDLNRFTVPVVFAEDFKEHEIYEWCYKVVATVLLEQPQSRERAKALNRLEESSMWAHVGLARSREEHGGPSTSRG